MSATRSATEYNVRLLIDDNDKDDYAISSVRMHQYLQGQMHLLASRMVLPMEAVTSIAVVAGTYDYTLSGTVGDIRQILWNATGQELERMMFDELNLAYLQDTAQGTGSGIPNAYAPFETSAQASKIRVAPTPNVSGVLKVYYGIVPAALTADTSVIPFSAPALRILERMVASECVALVGPEDLKRRMLSKDVVTLWQRMITQGISDENFRMRSQGSTQRRISEVEV